MDSCTLYFDHVILNGIQCYNHAILTEKFKNINLQDIKITNQIPKFSENSTIFEWKRKQSIVLNKHFKKFLPTNPDLG